MGFGGVSFRLLGQRGPEATGTIDRTRWPDDAALVAAIEAFAGPLSTFEAVPVRQGETPDNPTVTPMGGGWVPPELARRSARNQTKIARNWDHWKAKLCYNSTVARWAADRHSAVTPRRS